MSAKLLENPRKVHTLADDLESFLHVLAWIALRYIPAIDSFRSIDLAADLQIFDEYLPVDGQLDEGGRRKSDTLAGGSYPSRKFKPSQDTPLAALLVDLSKPFQSLYSLRPPTTEDRAKIGTPTIQRDNSLEFLRVRIHDYDEDIKNLASSSFFIDAIQRALASDGWPMDDKANLKLGIDLLTHCMERQQKRQTTLCQNTQEIFEGSIGLSRKRRRSATPPRSSKRHRSL